ncbi:hypothetical protein BJ322DRAFT_1023543 [Thelephora terrestris]|uniref:Uncharacterized protein n=1 Tax=Thelephora terrestris TaxID=56493 RepID=A0A9P6H6Y4_9AGAM|nr:hypothetical protein BJ322DRAFT_1023543 [Thelephora terrestris]
MNSQCTYWISGRYLCHSDTVAAITRYWPKFHRNQQLKKNRVKFLRPRPRPGAQEKVFSEPEVDNPMGSLKSFIQGVDNLLEEGSVGFEFVTTILLISKREINLFFPPAKSDRFCGINDRALRT